MLLWWGRVGVEMGLEANGGCGLWRLWRGRLLWCVLWLVLLFPLFNLALEMVIRYQTIVCKWTICHWACELTPIEPLFNARTFVGMAVDGNDGVLHHVFGDAADEFLGRGGGCVGGHLGGLCVCVNVVVGER